MYLQICLYGTIFSLLKGKGENMKKIILTLFVAIFAAVPSFAATYSAESRVPEIGKLLLTKNGIAITNVQFKVVSDDVGNSDFTTNKTVNVSKAKLSFAGNDNEVAAVVGNELGHLIAGHASKAKVLYSLQTTDTTTTTESDSTGLLSTAAINYRSTKEEKEADAIATNLMANAGYNPLALIVVLTKQTGTTWDAIAGRPANSERAMSVYDYTAYAYPAKVQAGYNCNEYKNFLTYANSVLQLRKENIKLETRNTKNVTKMRKSTLNRIQKFKIRGGKSGWDAVYDLMTVTQ